jgi:hypothetical protein
MSEHVSLDLIDPADLSTTVASSGLVTKDQLFDAFKAQALSAKERHGISYKKPRFQSAAWCTSNDAMLS